MSSTDVNPAAEKSERVYDPAPVIREEHSEGRLTRILEQQTAKIPSSFFLAAAIGSMVVSLGAELAGRKELSRFVGLWSSTLLLLGVYNKLVKSLGPR